MKIYHLSEEYFCALDVEKGISELHKKLENGTKKCISSKGMNVTVHDGDIPEDVYARYYYVVFPPSISASEKKSLYYLVLMWLMNEKYIKGKKLKELITSLVTDYSRGNARIMYDIEMNIVEYSKALDLISEEVQVDGNRVSAYTIIWYFAEKFLEITNNPTRRKLWQEVFDLIDNSKGYQAINRMRLDKVANLEKAFQLIDTELSKVKL